jgi:hypothetical protein
MPPNNPPISRSRIERPVISLFFDSYAAANPGFLRRGKPSSLIISCKNSKNSVELLEIGRLPRMYEDVFIP